MHIAAVGGEFDAVVEQVEPHLTQEVFVSGNGGLFEGYIYVKRFARPLRLAE